MIEEPGVWTVLQTLHPDSPLAGLHWAAGLERSVQFRVSSEGVSWGVEGGGAVR